MTLVILSGLGVTVQPSFLLDSWLGTAEKAYLDIFSAVGACDTDAHRLFHDPLDHCSHRGVNVIQPVLHHIHTPQGAFCSFLLIPGRLIFFSQNNTPAR